MNFKVGDKVLKNIGTRFAEGRVTIAPVTVPRLPFTAYEVEWLNMPSTSPWKTTIEHEEDLNFSYTNNSTTSAHFGMLNSNLGDASSIKWLNCECGTKNPTGQGHSHWCPTYKKEM